MDRRAARAAGPARGAETLAFLADRCEGNLFAAQQEIEKLGLLLPEGELPHEAVERAVADVARYDVAQLSEAWLGWRCARARCAIIAALEAEGEGLPLLLWQLGEDLHALAAIRDATAAGTPSRGRAPQRARLGQAPGRDGARRAARRPRRAVTPMLRALVAARCGVEGHRHGQRLGRSARTGAHARGPSGAPAAK